MRYKELYRGHKTGIVTSYEPRIGIVTALIPDRGAKILDVGCNDGFISQYLRKDGNTIVGIEINEELASVAAKGRLDQIIIQDVEEPWQVKDKDFDVVHLGYLLEHAFDYDFIFEEAYRCLRDEGILIISVPNFAYILHRVELLLGKIPRWYQSRKHIRAWTKSWLSKILKEKGFKPIHWYGSFAVSIPLLTTFAKYLPSLSSTLVCKAIKVKK